MNQPMEGSGKGKKPAETTEMENLSLDVSASTSRSSRDLLQRFMGSISSETTLREEEEEEDEDIELNLGLSLGGKFGADKISTNLIIRSSSIASCLPVVRDDNDAVTPPPAAAANSGGSLTRTSSLPVETEEDWRKRKELQCLRRMEAKRRRSEKQRNMMRSESGFSRVRSLSLEKKREIELNLRERLEREKGQLIGTKRSSSSQFGSSSNHGNVRGRDLSPYASIQSLQEGTNQRPNGENPCKRSDASTGTSSMGDMPCVFTKGDGPHGKRVDGILYRYGKGEQVKIMCICHGTFHSPPEFIRHAGGTDVDHPLKHIVVNPNTPAML